MSSGPFSLVDRWRMSKGGGVELAGSGSQSFHERDPLCPAWSCRMNDADRWLCGLNARPCAYVDRSAIRLTAGATHRNKRFQVNAPKSHPMQNNENHVVLHHIG